MTKKPNKAANVAQIRKRSKNTEKLYAIKLSPELRDGLRFISDKTYRTQIGVISEILNPMVQIGASFKKFNYWVHTNSNQITLTFFGESAMISGKNCLPEIEAEQKLDADIKKNLLGVRV
jgi:hypothetical protein